MFISLCTTVHLFFTVITVASLPLTVDTESSEADVEEIATNMAKEQKQPEHKPSPAKFNEPAPAQSPKQTSMSAEIQPSPAQSPEAKPSTTTVRINEPSPAKSPDPKQSTSTSGKIEHSPAPSLEPKPSKSISGVNEPSSAESTETTLSASKIEPTAPAEEPKSSTSKMPAPVVNGN